MIFTALLIAATTAIAFAAAYFSVYGLAYTFSGVFWSVVAMGASLEAGKLIAASYLYRYWHKTNTLLKTYLMLGVAALMLMTSVGIFGYLSSGYQQDVLPLKQKTEQVQLLEDEKSRMLERKKQIDDIMAGSTTVSTVEGAKGIDRNAVRALRETTRARESLVRQYKAEQKDVTERIKQLDAELLVLKQDLIKVEAHIGPITYIAKAFGQPTDDATKWLTFLIIFAFDPMAVALTLAVNTALRVRQEEKEGNAPNLSNKDAPETTTVEYPPQVEQLVASQQPLPDDMSKVLYDNLWDLYERTPSPEQEPLEWESDEPKAHDLEVVDVVQTAPEVEEPKESHDAPEIGSPRRTRPYANLWSGEQTQAKIDELVNHYQYLNEKIAAGHPLSKDEQWEFDATKRVLTNAGFSQYL